MQVMLVIHVMQLIQVIQVLVVNSWTRKGTIDEKLGFLNVEILDRSYQMGKKWIFANALLSTSTYHIRKHCQRHNKPRHWILRNACNNFGKHAQTLSWFGLATWTKADIAGWVSDKARQGSYFCHTMGLVFWMRISIGKDLGCLPKKNKT